MHLRERLRRPSTAPPGTMAELVEAFAANPGPKNLAALESALFVAGPVLYRGSAYGIAGARPVESIEVFADVKRAELVRIP